MTSGEFDTLMGIVYSRWNQKAYPDVVRNRIWYFVRDLPAKSFETMIYTLLDIAKSPPMPHEFKMLAYSEKERLGMNDDSGPRTKPSKDAQCWDCADGGNLFATHKKLNISTTFRCHCSAGAKLPLAHGPQWSNSFNQAYEKEPIYMKGAGDWRPKPDQGLRVMVDTLRTMNQEAARHRKSELLPIANVLDPNDKEPA